MNWNSMREGATPDKRSWIAGMFALLAMSAFAPSGMAQTIIIGGPSGQAVQTYSPYTPNQYRYYQPALPYRSGNRLPVYGQPPLRSGPGLMPLEKRLRLAPPLPNGSASAPVLKAPTLKAPTAKAPVQKSPVVAVKKPAQVPVIKPVAPPAKVPAIKPEPVEQPSLKVAPPPIEKPAVVATKPQVKADPSELKMPAVSRDNKAPVVAEKIAPPPAPEKPTVKAVELPATPPSAPDEKPVMKTAEPPEAKTPEIKRPKAVIVEKDETPAEVAALPKEQPASSMPGDTATEGEPLSLSFDKGEQKLTPSEKGKLDKFYASIAGKKVKIQLIAHADAGSGSASRRLSLSRALTVRSHLMNLGMPNTSIEVRALGLPKDDNNPDRVDLKMLDR